MKGGVYRMLTSRQPHDGQKRCLQLWLISRTSPQSGQTYVSIPKVVVRHTRIAFTALYCSGVMYSAGCCAYSSHHRLKKSDKRYFFSLQPSVYMSFSTSFIARTQILFYSILISNHLIISCLLS